jgi:PAS domain S-box-containing protein
VTAILDLPQLERALAAHALMSVTDLAGDILYANERFCTVSGYSRAELLGRNHRLLKSGVHAPAFYADLWRTLKSGQHLGWPDLQSAQERRALLGAVDHDAAAEQAG